MRSFAKCASCGAFYMKLMKECPFCRDTARIPIDCWTPAEVERWGMKD